MKRAKSTKKENSFWKGTQLMSVLLSHACSIRSMLESFGFCSSRFQVLGPNGSVYSFGELQPAGMDTDADDV